MPTEAAKKVTNNGYLSIYVPNTSRPTRYWVEIDHKTPWSFCGLYGLLKNCGFQIEIFARISKHRLTANPFERFVVSAVQKIYRVDWCDCTWVLGKEKVL